MTEQQTADDRAVLITGASSGVGAACALRLAEAGARVFAGVRKAEDGEALVQRAGGRVEPVLMDVTDAEAVAGADQITQELRRHLGIEEGQDTDGKRMFTVDQVACVGCCSLAPVMMLEDETAGRLTPASARQVLDEVAQESEE